MKTVLIVDDSAFMRTILKDILTYNGYQVVGEAGTGKAGIRKYKELQPDIVTMDITMDEMNGIEALSRIIGLNPDATVVMVTSIGQEIIVRDATMLGAKGYIVKPFDEKMVIDAFAQL